MRALLCKEFGPPQNLVVEEVPSLKPGAGQVIVRTRACGINFPDGLIVEGKYQVKPPLPFSPGLELAGTIKELGQGVAGLSVGQRVIAFPGSGGLSEEVSVDAGNVFPMPDSMDFTTGAGFTITYATSHHALKDRAQLKAGETLLVLGAAGGVGLTAVEIGKVLGARVIAAASSAEKLALCKQYGADELINYTTEDLRGRLKEITGGKGVDVVYDPVGGALAETAIRNLAWMGRYLVIGFAAGEIPKIALNLLLLKSSSLVGVYWGQFLKTDPKAGRAGMAELLSWYEQGKLKPYISATYPLERASEAILAVTGRSTKGKVVVTVD
ncbi:MAG TPA: NADPH:quinone oxidoreductase family protein [Alphaproteobacteria bacterium]|nr:NADPH:quinone oxidoreductase family protein [Alphaproteobacteria bacterium]